MRRLLVLLLLLFCIIAGPAWAISPDGTRSVAPSGGPLVTSDGTWSWGSTPGQFGYPILLNNSAANGGAATLIEVASGGHLFAQNALNQWYEWTGAAYVQVAGDPLPPPTFTLSIGAHANGTITSNTGGINCGSACSAVLNSGSSITLTEAPSNGGYTFSGWGGACSGTSPTCVITMSSDQSVTANFAGISPVGCPPGTPPNTICSNVIDVPIVINPVNLASKLITGGTRLLTGSSSLMVAAGTQITLITGNTSMLTVGTSLATK